MPLTFSWTDFPERYDDDSKLSEISWAGDFAELIRRFSDGEKKHSDVPHIFIMSDNYPALKLMAQNALKVDIIYIDPPYNTGKSFSYNDDFADGKDRHSAWLSFMSRRLNIAKKLMKETSCIFIAIDQSELYVLKLLCDKIFGEENFVNDFMWLHGKGKKDKWSRTLQQHTLCYAKDKKNLAEFRQIEKTGWATKNEDDDQRGNWFSGSISFSEKRSNPNHKNYFTIKSPSGKLWTRQWQVSKEKMEKLIADNRIYWGHQSEYSSVPRIKIFNDDKQEVIPKNIIDCVESTRSAQNNLDKLIGIKCSFDNPKPVDLIEHLIKITSMPTDALILDFFAGSGTTFEAVCRLNKEDGGKRKCILIQKDENEIAEICKKRCDKVSQLFDEEITQLQHIPKIK
ncbi:site-specific DNA-methyltransferase [Treponema sp. Marseille-Q3903]|uniref:site-specific DNA-methyltransferase n=1 Tax=Treponema sp. Marseille-Q3903 TaxID=2766703 RepID=UPI001652A4D8|nr:site-specific DNA-methyltransferase [Treponema sp. Marseille-Q3903]MBC6712786.1 site-specific DNA-methyltransferase [Treponema sp. Marseille-Q3903]